MKRYAARIALLLGSIGLSLAGNLIAFISALAGSERAWPVAVANDQTLNAALVGRPGAEDETISSRAAKARRAGRRWGCILCRWLDHIDPGHCERNIETDEGDAVSPAGTTGQPARPRMSRPSSSHT